MFTSFVCSVIYHAHQTSKFMYMNHLHDKNNYANEYQLLFMSLCCLCVFLSLPCSGHVS